MINPHFKNPFTEKDNPHKTYSVQSLICRPNIQISINVISCMKKKKLVV